MRLIRFGKHKTSAAAEEKTAQGGVPLLPHSASNPTNTPNAANAAHTPDIANAAAAAAGSPSDLEGAAEQPEQRESASAAAVEGLVGSRPPVVAASRTDEPRRLMEKLSLGEGSAASCNLSVTEGEVRPLSSHHKRARNNRGADAASRCFGPRAVSSRQPTVFLKDSTSSLYLAEKGGGQNAWVDAMADKSW